MDLESFSESAGLFERKLRKRLANSCKEETWTSTTFA